MAEIDNYSAQLDLVKAKGKQLMEANPHQPQLIQHTQDQLSNLDDSYLSLQATSMQIKVSKTNEAKQLKYLFILELKMF